MPMSKAIQRLLITSLLCVLPSSAHADVFEVEGSGASWIVQDFFSKAQFDSGEGQRKLGYEFGPILVYRGPTANIQWYRIEAFLADDPLSDPKPDCAVVSQLVGPDGPRIAPGQVFTHGRCRIFTQSLTEAQMKQAVLKGAYVVTWRSGSGLHAESIPVTLTDRR